jgi:hypothetical protein
VLNCSSRPESSTADASSPQALDVGSMRPSHSSSDLLSVSQPTRTTEGRQRHMQQRSHGHAPRPHGYSNLRNGPAMSHTRRPQLLDGRHDASPAFAMHGAHNKPILRAATKPKLAGEIPLAGLTPLKTSGANVRLLEPRAASASAAGSSNVQALRTHAAPRFGPKIPGFSGKPPTVRTYTCRVVEGLSA